MTLLKDFLVDVFRSKILDFDPQDHLAYNATEWASILKVIYLLLLRLITWSRYVG